MNDTPAGIAGIAGQAIDAMRSQPLVLALLLFNLVFLGAMFWTAAKAGDRHERLYETLLQHCLPERK